MRERWQQFVAATAAISSGALGTTVVVAATRDGLAASNAPATLDANYNTFAGVQAETGVGQPVAAAFGNGKHLTMTLNPTSIPADGKSTTQAKASVFVVITVNGQEQTLPWSCNSIAFSSSDPGDQVSAASPPSGPGPFTATITASKTAGSPTITATCVAPTGSTAGTTTLTAQATLTQVGPAISLTIKPSSIPADGTSTTTGTATVKTAAGQPETGDTVKFASSDPKEKFSAVSGHGDGTYTVTITASSQPETATITATDTSVQPSVHASATLKQTAVAAAVPNLPATGAPPAGTTLAAGGTLPWFPAALFAALVAALGAVRHRGLTRRRT